MKRIGGRDHAETEMESEYHYISERPQESLRPISRCAMTTVVAPMGR